MAHRSAAPGGEASRAGLWLVLLGPPIVWAVRFGAAYALVPYACRADAMVLLHGLTLLALAIVALLGLLAWRYHVSARAAAPARALAVRSARFISLFGLLGSLLFALVIVAEAIGNVMIDPCTGWGPLLP